MTLPLKGLEPREIWAHFEEIAKIPRGSGNEAAAREYVLGRARRRGFEHSADGTGNVVIRKPARPGKEAAAAVALQSHLDMVCVKDDAVEHDFERDPIRLKREGDWLKAGGTTLGADNGIGVAAALAVMESDAIAHGPLEFIFTVDEETGLTGATNFPGGLLASKYLLNLDNEEQNTLCIGCAGGLNTNARAAVSLGAPRFDRAHRIRITGLVGGHSGIDIHRGRGNAILILARVLQALNGEVAFEVADFKGGVMRNVIPRDAFAVIVAAAKDAQRLRDFAERSAREIRSELGRADPGLEVLVEETGLPNEVIAAADTSRILDLLACLPNGVLNMSPEIDGLVQTSTNVGTIALYAGKLEIATLQRSSVDSARFGAGRAVQAAFRLAGFETEVVGGYPGWKPEPDSELVQTAKKVHEEVLGQAPRLTAMHAGLECGVIGEKYPGMQMISLGPEIVGAHSPGERVDIPSVVAFWRYLKTLLERLQ